MLISSILGSAGAMATLPGSLELFLLTAGGVLPRRSNGACLQPLRKLAVVIPAHNEAENIGQCVQSLRDAEPPNASLKLVVTADNCTDDTAARAKKAGADVLVRSDPSKRGKGYALEFAFGKLLQDPDVDAVLVVDADTIVSRNFLIECENILSGGADGVQARYLVKHPESSERARLMNTALLAFNVLRPRGRDRLGFSTGILGNGWGLARRCLERVPYNAHSVVEDLEYHIRLVREGMRIRFVDRATVFGEMPTGDDAAETQRARWEGGRFRMIKEQVPELLRDLRKGRLSAMEPLGELLLLPLAYHVGGLVVTAAIPFPPTQVYALFGIGLVASHVACALAVGGGTKEDLKALFNAPKYILWKAAMLNKIFAASRKEQDWVRTERNAEKA